MCDGLSRMSTILLLGGTGKTARRIAPRLTAAGATVRTAARNGADVRFDWDDPPPTTPRSRASTPSTSSRRPCAWTTRRSSARSSTAPRPRACAT